jgi:hypothetical protein
LSDAFRDECKRAMSLETEGRLYTFVILECCGIEQGVGWGFSPGDSAINLRFSRPAANKLHLSANNLLDEDEVCQHSEILQHIPEGAAYNEPPFDPRARVPCHMICPQEAQRLLANQHQQWVLFCTRCTESRTPRIIPRFAASDARVVSPKRLKANGTVGCPLDLDRHLLASASSSINASGAGLFPKAP